MNVSNYTDLDYEGLSKEIDKINRKIRTLQDTVRLLKKLQIAEQAKGRSRHENDRK